MKTAFRSVVLLGVLVLSATASAPGEALTLRVKFTKGESLRYRMTQEQTMESEMLGEVENTNAFVFRQDVTDVTADGTGTLDVRYEAVRMETGGQASMSYDSTLTGDAAKRNSPILAKIFGPMLEAKLSMTMEPTGRVASIRGVDEMLAKCFPSSAKPNPMDPASMMKEMFNEDSLKRLVEVNVFPTEAIEPGHKWSRNLEQPLPMFGTMKLSFENHFVGIEDHAGQRCAKLGITGRMTFEEAKEKALPMKISIESPSLSGTMFFAVDQGRMLDAQIDTTMDMHMEAGGEGAQQFAMDMAITSVQRIQWIANDAPAFE